MSFARQKVVWERQPSLCCLFCNSWTPTHNQYVFIIYTEWLMLMSWHQASVLVLCYTRELAYQICHEFDRFKKYMPTIKTAVFYGGIPVSTHKDLLRDEQPHIIIGTPGRILQLAEDKNLVLKNVKHFVLDECDKMLDSLGIPIISACYCNPFNASRPSLHAHSSLRHSLQVSEAIPLRSLLQTCERTSSVSSSWPPTTSKWWCSPPPCQTISGRFAKNSCTMYS